MPFGIRHAALAPRLVWFGTVHLPRIPVANRHTAGDSTAEPQPLPVDRLKMGQESLRAAGGRREENA